MTEEKRLARNAYMREYGKRDSVKATRREKRKLLKPTLASRARNVEAQHRHRWGYGYYERLVQQDGLCALCGQPFDDTPLGRPAQDHDHETGMLREFLHRRCNLAIGHLLDNPAICHKAAEYLERHGKKTS